MTATLAVVGAINVDLVVRGVRLPRAGQTVVGGTFERHFGGKGGNQAVAAARDGAPVAMVGAVGDDDLGVAARGALEAEGIDVSRVRVADDIATGTALIAVNARGENQIVVAPGANDALEEVATDLDALEPALVLISWEIPAATCREVGSWCAGRRVPMVVNPAPASLRVRSLLDHAAVATPNREEVTDLVAAETDPVRAAQALRRRNDRLAVVITLGEDGALIVDDVRRDRGRCPADGRGRHDRRRRLLQRRARRRDARRRRRADGRATRRGGRGAVRDRRRRARGDAHVGPDRRRSLG